MARITTTQKTQRIVVVAGLLLITLGPSGFCHAAPPQEQETQQADSQGGLAEILRASAKALGKPAPQREGTAAKEFQEIEPRGTSAGSARKAAQAAIPVDKLTPENQKRVTALLKSVSFYRRLPKVTFAVEPEVYAYFINHPDVAVSIWRAMKISKLEMWQTGRYDYEAKTDDGSSGTLEVLYNGPEHQLVLSDGEYKSPLLAKPIAARSLLLLQTSFMKEADGTVYCTHRADLWVTFPSQAVEVVTKIFSPLAVSMTDRTFTEVSLFLKMMSLAMSHRPDWVEQITTKMEGVPELRIEQVRELTTQVFGTVQKRVIEKAIEAESKSPERVAASERSQRE